MNILAFDTATNACSAALYVSGQVFSRFEIAPRLHSSLLLPMIQALLSQAKINLSDLQAIAFGCGPGSFMGVRLATGMAQGLAFGLQIPVIPISTLQVIAQTAYEKTNEKKIAVGWDARMSEIYWGFYACDEKGVMQAQQEDALCTPKQLDIKLLFPVGCFFAGNAWALVQEKIRSDIEIYPEAKAMLTIALSKYTLSETISPENAHPHYVRHVVYTTTK